MERRLMLRCVVCVLLVCVLSGCFAAIAHQAWNESGATADSRQSMLAKRLTDLQAVLVWNRPAEILAFGLPEARKALGELNRNVGGDVHIVEAQAEGIEPDQEYRNAVVHIRVKYYRVPYYRVETRSDRLTWTFALPDGWKIKAAEKE
jgi:hypothetical protein